MQKERKYISTDYRVALIEIKSLAGLALKQLESVTEEELPEDKEFCVCIGVETIFEG